MYDDESLMKWKEQLLGQIDKQQLRDNFIAMLLRGYLEGQGGKYPIFQNGSVPVLATAKGSFVEARTRFCRSAEMSS